MCIQKIHISIILSNYLDLFCLLLKANVKKICDKRSLHASVDINYFATAVVP